MLLLSRLTSCAPGDCCHLPSSQADHQCRCSSHRGHSNSYRSPVQVCRPRPAKTWTRPRRLISAWISAIPPNPAGSLMPAKCAWLGPAVPDDGRDAEQDVYGLSACPLSDREAAMFDRPDRLQLVSLTDEEITALVRAVPGLAASWAKSADIDIEWLEADKLPALAERRPTMPRQKYQLVAVLARTGLETMLAILDSAEFDQDSSEGADELAAAAGGFFGSVAAALFLSAVAAGSDPLAGEVAGRLAELQVVGYQLPAWRLEQRTWQW
jgi:hypothetical protein